ncbi:MAG TPA: AraC family transcriptional regulator [Spirochaetota bacterium]|nr:AraC family transcriptional regulator [Spirochaetota bacterium]HNT12285.1 AraC family transcriptional regulator [Spirochaetota bacterium]
MIDAAIADALGSSRMNPATRNIPPTRTGRPLSRARAAAALCAIALSLAFFACAASGDRTDACIIDLSGEWRIVPGDDAGACPDPGDRRWETIRLPGSIIDHSRKRYGRAEGIVWIRKTVRVDAGCRAGGIGLELGKIGNADRTHANGVFIGSDGRFPPRDFSRWNAARLYFIPESLIGPDGALAITARIAYAVHGEVRGPLRLLDAETWRAVRSRDALLTDLRYAGMAAVGAAGFIFLLIFIRRPQRQEYLFFALQCVPGFLVIHDGMGTLPIYGSVGAQVKLLGFAWAALVATQLGFLHRLYGLRRRAVDALLWAMLAIVTLTLVFAYDPRAHERLALGFVIALTSLALYNISIHAQMLARGNAYAKLLIVPGIVLSLSAAHDGIGHLPRFGGPSISIAGYGFQEPVIGYGAAMMLVVAAVILVHRFISAMRAVEDMNIVLERRVRERTAELEKSLHDLSNFIDNTYLDQRIKAPRRYRTAITPAAEEKIKKAILYINENFTEDISREGLAASLGINPDYLGKLFLVFTGKKIMDYIHELRIKKAVVMLEEGDDTIIDIAFAVGFESVRTFNRAFHKHLKIRPSQYRRGRTAAE